MSMFKIFQCPQNAFKCRALSVTWHWANLLSPCLTKCVCFFCTLKPLYHPWNAGSLYPYMTGNVPSLRNQLKVSLPKTKVLNHQLFYPWESDILFLTACRVQFETLLFFNYCTAFTIRRLTPWDQGACFLPCFGHSTGHKREVPQCIASGFWAQKDFFVSESSKGSIWKGINMNCGLQKSFSEFPNSLPNCMIYLKYQFNIRLSTEATREEVDISQPAAITRKLNSQYNFLFL